MVTKKILKLAAGAMLITTLFAVPVMAEMINFSFRVEIADDADQEQYSDNAEKEDSSSTAYINYTDSNITASDDFRFAVVGQEGDYSTYSESVCATASTGVYRPRYTSEVYEGNMYRLRGRTYEYYVVVSGEWEP